MPWTGKVFQYITADKHIYGEKLLCCDDLALSRKAVFGRQCLHGCSHGKNFKTELHGFKQRSTFLRNDGDLETPSHFYPEGRNGKKKGTYPARVKSLPRLHTFFLPRHLSALPKSKGETFHAEQSRWYVSYFHYMPPNHLSHYCH